MAWTAPTEAEFVAAFPAFSDVDASAINAALDEAALRVDETWLSESDFRTAQMLYAAHVLTLGQLGTGTEAQLAGFRRIKMGSLELERERGSAAAAGSLGSTSYGQRFLALLRINHPGVAVA